MSDFILFLESIGCGWLIGLAVLYTFDLWPFDGKPFDDDDKDDSAGAAVVTP